MNCEMELTTKGTPRKRRLKGFDPHITGRAPAPVLEMVRAKAAERNVSVSAIIREALCQYVEGQAVSRVEAGESAQRERALNREARRADNVTGLREE